MYKILIKPLARNDIKGIWRYTYNNWGIGQADSYTKELGAAIESLVTNPKIGFAIDNIRIGYRVFRFKHHLVVYYLADELIEINRVLGEKMDPRIHI